MTDYRELIEQLSPDRADVVVYADFDRNGAIKSVVDEKTHMATESQRAIRDTLFDAFASAVAGSGVTLEEANAAFANWGSRDYEPATFSEATERLSASASVLRHAIADEMRSYFASIE